MAINTQQSHWYPGVPLALAAALLFGASTPLSKLLLNDISPLLLAGVLYFGAGIGLTFLLALRALNGKISGEARLSRADLPWLAAIIVVGGVVGPCLLMFGLATSDASTASLLLNLESVTTMVIAWLVFKENVDRPLLVGAFAILFGAILLSWSGNGLQFDRGSLYVAGACLAWGIDNNLTRKLSHGDPVQLAAVKGLVAGAINVSFALYLGAELPTWPLSLAGGVLGFFAIGLSLVMFIKGLRHLGTARTGAYFAIAPFVGALLAIVILREPISAMLLPAAVLMAIGLWLHLAERHDHDHFHDDIEHDHRHSHDEHHSHSHDGNVVEPHSHTHRHQPITHRHAHYPDLHHRHGHKP